jgi:hypothetical protein
VLARILLSGITNWRLGEILGFSIAGLFLGALWGPMIWRAYRDEGH